MMYRVLKDPISRAEYLHSTVTDQGEQQTMQDPMSNGTNGIEEELEEILLSLIMNLRCQTLKVKCSRCLNISSNC